MQKEYQPKTDWQADQIRMVSEAAKATDHFTEDELEAFAEKSRRPAKDDPSKPMTWSKCFAVPGSDSIIDIIHPLTGLSQCYSKSLAAVRGERPEYALAEIMDVAEHCTSKAKRQDARGTWEETTEEEYHDMLNVLPPASWVRFPEGRSGFLVGEPYDHHAGTGQPRFACFKMEGGKYHKFSRPMTFMEFKGEFGETARYGYVS